MWVVVAVAVVDDNGEGIIYYFNVWYNDRIFIPTATDALSVYICYPISLAMPEMK